MSSFTGLPEMLATANDFVSRRNLVVGSMRPATRRERLNLTITRGLEPCCTLAIFDFKRNLIGIAYETGPDPDQIELLWADSTVDPYELADLIETRRGPGLQPSTKYPPKPDRTRENPYKLRKTGRFLLLFPAYSIKKTR